MPATAPEAIEMMDRQHYSVLVLDLMMPQVDGYALLEHLKSRGGHLPAVIVISAGDSAALRQLDGAMVHSIVRKPFDIDVLGDLITAAARSKEEPADMQPGVLRFPRPDTAC